MPRDGSGTYTAPSNSWNAAVEGTTIDEADWGELLDDLESAISGSLTADGQKVISSHIDFDENGSPGTPASDDGRLYAADAGGVTSLYFKDSAGTVTNLLIPAATLPFTFNSSTDTASDPGANKVAFNDATISSVTEIAVDDLDAYGADVSAFVLSWDDEGTSNRGHLIVRNRTTGGNVAIFKISGASTDESGWTRLAVTYVTHAGSFVNNDPLTLTYGSPGPAGAAGSAGPAGTDPGVAYTFSTDTTTTTDPGTGNLELNNATLASVTEIALDDNSAATGNPDISAWLATLDDSTSTTKGQLFIKKNSAPENFAIYEIASITDATTHYRVTVTHVDSAGSFSASDALSVQFYPRGDAGSGSVSSVFGRSGAVVAANSDYDITQVDFSASDRIAGRATSGAGLAEELTPAQVRTIINVEDGATADQTAADIRALGFFDTSNDGAASGLDADLLDGNHASAFATSGHNHSGVYEPVDAEIVRADTDDNFTAGYTATADNDGTQSSGTYTPDPAGGNLKRIVNGGAFTLAAPSATGDYTIIIQITNNGSAGSVTTSGFESETGDSLTTTDGDDFFAYITKLNGFQSLHIVALQ